MPRFNYRTHTKTMRRSAALFSRRQLGLHPVPFVLERADPGLQRNNRGLARFNVDGHSGYRAREALFGFKCSPELRPTPHPPPNLAPPLTDVPTSSGFAPPFPVPPIQPHEPQAITFTWPSPCFQATLRLFYGCSYMFHLSGDNNSVYRF